MIGNRVSGARTAVFETTELAEMIFLELPMCDILQVQQVCKRWTAIVNSSLKLQQALFKQSCTPKALHWEVGSATSSKTQILTHPVLSEACARSRSGYSCHSIWQLKPGSWLQHFISQPPLASVNVCIDIDSSQPKVDDFDVKIEVKARSGRTGVTWGDIVDDMRGCNISKQPEMVIIMGSGMWRNMEWKEKSSHREIQAVKEEKDFGPWKFQGDFGGAPPIPVEPQARNLSLSSHALSLKSTT